MVARALAAIASTEPGEAACVAASAPAALVGLAWQPAVKECADAAQAVAHALLNLAWTDGPHRAACIAAGAAAALAALAAQPAVKASKDAAAKVAEALTKLK